MYSLKLSQFKKNHDFRNEIKHLKSILPSCCYWKSQQLVGFTVTLGPLQLHLEPLGANLESIHRLDGHLGWRRVVVAYEPCRSSETTNAITSIRLYWDETCCQAAIFLNLSIQGSCSEHTHILDFTDGWPMDWSLKSTPALNTASSDIMHWRTIYLSVNFQRSILRWQ